MILEYRKCEALVNAELKHSYRYKGAFGMVTCSLHKCPKCQSPLLTEEDAFSTELLYPPQNNSVNPYLPEPLRRSYEEALACFKGKAYTATAIMCRKTLEGICVEHGTTGRTLALALKELKDKGIIESRLYEWANELRVSGNEAAHDVKATTSSEDARDILEFTNALLEYVFTFRDKFEEFKKRRNNKTAP